MKKLILEILKKHYDRILKNWTSNVLKSYQSKLSESQIRTFAESSLNVLLEVIETTDYTSADQYLIETYNLFSEVELNLLQISNIFNIGRHALVNEMQKHSSDEYDPVILLGFIDELIDQVFARYGIIHQNAEMKELTKERNRLAKKLETNQKYLSNILHNTESAIAVIDKNEKFESWNTGAEIMFGYTEKEIIGKPSTILLPDDEKYIRELNYIKDEAYQSNEVRIIDTERKTRDGNIIPVELSVAPLPSNNGRYSGRTVIIKDQSHVKQLQQQIDQSEKLAVIGQLAAGIAHEIGNPLASISSLVQLIQRQTKEEPLNEQLITIRENIDRITKIVRELVDFSRPPSYKRELIQITDIVKTAVGIVKYDKRVKKVDFETEFGPDVPMIRIVPDQMLQVFVNILINALDAVEGEGSIKVNTIVDGDKIVIKFSDNGCGMSEETKKLIFDPFFSTKEVGKGTGLGLSVSYGILRKFGGDISVESEIEKGSCFCVKLPVKENT
jgi:PAS domain S-box-containing protein